MQVRIIGIKKGETKNQKVFFNYYGVKEFSDYDRANAECKGQEPIDAFSYTDYNLEIGDLVDFQYEPGFQGRATLSNIVMIEPAGNPYEAKEEKKAAK